MEEHEVGVHPQQKASSWGKLARSEGRMEQTHWTEDERIRRGLEDSDRIDFEQHSQNLKNYQSPFQPTR